MAAAERLFGGLLTRVGEAALVRHDQLREDALIRAQAEREDRRIREERQFRRQEAAADREAARGLLSGTAVGEGRQMYGITRGGERVDLGFRAAPSASSADASGFSAGDKRVWDMAVARHTTETMQGDQTDWTGVAETLTSQGRPDLAQMAAPARGGTQIDTNSAQWTEAQRQAQDEAKSRNPRGPDYFRPEAVKRAYEGMTRAEWTNRRTQEIYRELTGQPAAGAAQAADRASGAQGESQYNSADEVREAFRAGRITRDQAMQILVEQFPNEI